MTRISSPSTRICSSSKCNLVFDWLFRNYRNFASINKYFTFGNLKVSSLIRNLFRSADSVQCKFRLARLIQQKVYKVTSTSHRDLLELVQLCGSFRSSGLLYGPQWRWNKTGHQIVLPGSLGLWAHANFGYSNASRRGNFRFLKGISHHEYKPMPCASSVLVLQDGERKQDEAFNAVKNLRVDQHLLPESLRVQLSKFWPAGIRERVIRKRVRISR